MLEGLDSVEVETSEGMIFARLLGSGPALLLLHGFPQTHLMWRLVAPLLADRFSVVCADLRGYGQSGCPPSDKDHLPYSKRVMAAEMVEVMAKLGHPVFSVAGHDRGGRVAYRMALDHPEAVSRLAVLDIVPTVDAWDFADARFVLDFWPWSLLAQPEPFPEQLIAGAPESIVEDALRGWGTPRTSFPENVRASYVESLRDPAHIHAICEEYRAGSTIDRQIDDQDRKAGKRIRCPVLVLWSVSGSLAKWYEKQGGPLGIWKTWATEVAGHAVNGGHFFPEEIPETTAEALARFF